MAQEEDVVNEIKTKYRQIDLIFGTNNIHNLLELLKSKATVLGTIKKSANVSRNVVDGLPVVIANKGTDVAKAYMEIALKID